MRRHQDIDGIPRGGDRVADIHTCPGALEVAQLTRTARGLVDEVGRPIGEQVGRIDKRRGFRHGELEARRICLSRVVRVSDAPLWSHFEHVLKSTRAEAQLRTARMSAATGTKLAR